MNANIIPGGIYKHYKGNKYHVIGIAKHSETLEELVVYEALYDNPTSKLWVRPKKMFLGEVEIDGEKKSRFQLVATNSQKHFSN